MSLYMFLPPAQRRWIQNLKAPPFLCKIIGHKWEIYRLVNNSGNLVNHARNCLRCHKIQELQRPKEYHPLKYVWGPPIDAPYLNQNQKGHLSKRVSDMIRKTGKGTF